MVPVVTLLGAVVGACAGGPIGLGIGVALGGAVDVLRSLGAGGQPQAAPVPQVNASALNLDPNAVAGTGFTAYLSKPAVAPSVQQGFAGGTSILGSTMTYTSSPPKS